MTMIEALAMAKGHPIEVFNGDPMEIPCIETSEAEKLCKHPVVSVKMLTYNHEPYIRQAIEGVLMQQTDFEYELLIGEDCSQDKTREICFEYQKKHPDKVRVLWSHENLYEIDGNSRRLLPRCRGQYLAFCEGDDYWTDPLKLQKQVDLIRKTNSVMCVANVKWELSDGTIQIPTSKYYVEQFQAYSKVYWKEYFHTSTYLLDLNVYRQCQARYAEIIYWFDQCMLKLMPTMGQLCFLPDVVSVYRWTGKGISNKPGSAKRDWLTVTIFTQFALCSEPILSKIYHKKLIKCLVNMYYKRNRFTPEEHNRIWDMVVALRKGLIDHLRVWLYILKYKFR